MSHTTSDAPPVHGSGQTRRCWPRSSTSLFPSTAQVHSTRPRPKRRTFHNYTGNAIPWFVRVIWIIFWCFAIAYVMTLAASVPSVRAAVATMSSLRPEPRVCDYCQSPMPASWWGPAATNGEPATDAVYCCLGCRMAAGIVQEKGEAGAARGMLTRLGLSIFFTMNVMAFTMALWTTDVYGRADRADHLLDVLNGLFRYLVLLFSMPVVFLLGIPLARAAWENLRRGIVSTDALLCLGVGAAFASSFFSVLGGGGPIYFEVGCVILVMTTLGRWLEATGRLKASSALDELARLLPETVRRLGATGEEVVPLDQVVRRRPVTDLARRAVPRRWNG